jgi:hypothetical protein
MNSEGLVLTINPMITQGSTEEERKGNSRKVGSSCVQDAAE